MQRRNLADPSFEPTDADLRELAQRAAVDVRERQERARRELRERIAREREAAFELFRRASAP
jgi:hypothetical protein